MARVAVVGVGGMGRKHLEVLSSLPGVDVAAVCDLDPERLADLAVERFRGVDAMLDATPLDLVVVATPPVERVGPVEATLGRGVAVLCEKPLAITLEAADRMLDAADGADRILAVHHQLRCSPALTRCREWIESGRIGEVVGVRGHGKAGRRAGIELLEIGIHLADTMVALFGAPGWCAASVFEGDRLAEPGDVRPSQVVAPDEADHGPVLGTRVAASYGFPGGVLGELHFHGFEERRPSNCGIEVIGTRGRLAWHCSRFVERPLWYLPRPQVGTPDEAGDWKPVDVPEPGNRGLVEAHHRQLLAALDGTAGVPCDGRQGRVALEMVLAVYRSHEEAGRRVPLPGSSRAHCRDEGRRGRVSRPGASFVGPLDSAGELYSR